MGLPFAAAAGTANETAASVVGLTIHDGRTKSTMTCRDKPDMQLLDRFFFFAPEVCFRAQVNQALCRN